MPWRLAVYRIGFVAALAITTVLCLKPSDWQAPPGISDKIKHALAYAVIAALGLLGFRRREIRLPLVLGLLSWGIAIEFIQPHFGRSFEVLDMVANGLGIAFSTVLLVRFQPKSGQPEILS